MKTFAMIGVMVMVLGAFAGMVNAMGPMDGLNAKGDNDRDGLTNAQEYLWGTDPNNPSSAGTGIYDGWMVWYEEHRAVDKNSAPIISNAYHFDPNDASLAGSVATTQKDNLIQVRDGDANTMVNDPDGDGWNNLHEFLVGSDPTNPNTDGDSYAQDSSDPDPLVSNDDGSHDHTTPGGNGGPGSGHGNMGGNGGGGSGIGAVIDIL